MSNVLGWLMEDITGDQNMSRTSLLECPQPVNQKITGPPYREICILNNEGGLVHLYRDILFVYNLHI